MTDLERFLVLTPQCSFQEILNYFRQNVVWELQASGVARCLGRDDFVMSARNTKCSQKFDRKASVKRAYRGGEGGNV